MQKSTQQPCLWLDKWPLASAEHFTQQSGLRWVLSQTTSLKLATLPSSGYAKARTSSPKPQNSCPHDPAASSSSISTSYPWMDPRIDADCPSAPKGPTHFQWGSGSHCQHWPSLSLGSGSIHPQTVSIFHESWTRSAHRGSRGVA